MFIDCVPSDCYLFEKKVLYILWLVKRVVTLAIDLEMRNAELDQINWRLCVYVRKNVKFNSPANL